MTIKLNETIILIVSILPRKKKINPKLYDLYLHFDIREFRKNGITTEFSTGQIIPIKYWDSSKKSVKGSYSKSTNLDDIIADYYTNIRKHFASLSANTISTALIVVSIKTSLKPLIVGKAARGEKYQVEEKPKIYTIDYVMEALYKHKKQSEGRKRIYKHAVGILHQFYKNKTPEITNISESDLIAFQDWYKETYRIKSGRRKGESPQQNSTSTWFAMIAAIFLHAVKRLKILPVSPLPERFRGGYKDSKRIVLSSSECMRIIEVDDNILSRTELIGKYCLLFQFLTGICYGDLLTLSLEEVKFDEEVKQWYIQKNRNKTGVEFIVFLSERAKYAFDKLRQITPAEYGAFALPTIDYTNRIYNVIAVKCKINIRITTYTLRHTYAVNFMELDGRIEDLQKNLGHEDLRTTQIYGKINRKRLNQVTRALEMKSEMHRYKSKTQ